ncbi:GNAT family N-acetyltransferase [Nostoc sp. CHAB 5836]|uniref:GNAT family N-acetyltransferase n=1 Tax=Nostoc sp. CHAB 5836 TaxID=2780404 RepID=UPI001E5A0A0A|nr:GNAT family N-acetyltransferase [Nostoc sp. CHAB 5836]MCC5617515.1 GNAT family N-acetyltransferase [Nostoc sp. CHAB 5836]
MNHSLHITTQRLELLPCSLEVSQAVITRNKLQVERLLGVRVPDDWYESEVSDILPIYGQMLIDDPSQLGWGVWLMIHIADSTLIGDLGFLGKPDRTGTVEMGYEVLSAYRRQGFTFEAVEALVNFAFTQPQLKRIIAHSPDDHVASIRILEKLGMEQIAKDENLLEWELRLGSR